MSTLCYFLLVVLKAYQSYAAPIHSSVPPNEHRVTLASSRSQPEPERTLFNITYSCALTVVICAWTSIHPESRGQALSRRVKMMFWTVVAPELVLAWAVRQWFAAREAKHTFNNSVRGRQRSKRWTMLHGHLLVMGGYTLINRDSLTIEEPYEPGWIAWNEEWEYYDECHDEYNSQVERSQLGVLTLERFKQLMEDPSFKFPTVNVAELEDKSKSDALSKLIAIVQTIWFILQCVSRRAQGLVLTELELVTLALASLNGITYMFWWNKPQGVKQPVGVYVAARPTDSNITRQEFGYDDDKIEVGTGDIVGAVADELSQLTTLTTVILRGLHSHICTFFICFEVGVSLVFLVTCPLLIPTFFVIFPLAILFLLHLIKTKKVKMAKEDDLIAVRAVLALGRLRYNLTYRIRKFFNTWLTWAVSNNRMIISTLFVFPPLFIILVALLLVLSPLFVVFTFASFIFTAVFGIVTTNTVRNGAKYVPSFYAPPTKSDRFSRMIVFAIFGVIFGGIHCAGWNFSFPTHFERSLWRITALMLTVIPFVAAPIDWVLENRRGKLVPFVRIVLELFMTVFLSTYVLSRLSLIVQALALLREQPADAFIAVDWTNYIPHIS